MRRDDLTLAGFGPLFRRLMFAHQRHIPDKDLDETIGVYFDAIRRFSGPIVEQAVEQLVREPSRFFPKAGEIYAVCRQLEGERDRRAGQAFADPTGDCPSCGQAIVVAGYERPNGTVLGRVRCGCIAPGQGWYTSAARAWVDPGPPTTAGLRAALTGNTTRTKGVVDLRTQFTGNVPADAGDAWED